jgi:hypothetical protein
MVKRGLQLVVLAIIGALLANAQCFAYCSTAVCLSSTAGAKDHCHQHSSRDSSQPEGACLHHHSQTFSPESGPDLAKLAQASILHFPPAVAISRVALVPPAHELWITLDPAPPPRTKVFLSLSILRI